MLDTVLQGSHEQGVQQTVVTSLPSKSLFSSIFLSSLLIKSLPWLRKNEEKQEKKEKDLKINLRRNENSIHQALIN
jgi:hypothetical protein